MQTNCVKESLARLGCAKIDQKLSFREAVAEAGVQCVELHGCTGQGCSHVYGPADIRELCPICNNPRYSASSKKPKEKVLHFPIRPRLEALMKLKSFRQLLQVHG